MIRLAVVFIICLIFAGQARATWQSELEAVFDIVSTFDELQTWQPTESTSGIYYSTNVPNSMPKKIDGSASIWQAFQISTAPKADYIGVQPTGYVWNGTKSACINTHDSMGSLTYAGYGPDRLLTFFGNGTSMDSGYREMHVFFMLKFHAGYFDETAGTFGDMAVTKMFEAMQGFTAINYHGDATWHAGLCNDVRVLTDYGTNDTIFNNGGGGLSYPTQLFLLDNTFLPEYKTTTWNGDINCYGYTSVQRTGAASAFNLADMADQYTGGLWTGVELVYNTGTVGSANGSLSVTYYDESGTQIGTESFTNITMSQVEQMSYNKFSFGGNKTTQSGDVITYEDRYYVDDFIIHGSEIAPTYFAMLNAAPDTTAPIITAASVNGTAWSTTADEAINTAGYDANDCSATCTTAGTVNLTSPTGTGSSRSWTGSVSVAYGDTCTLGCTLATGDITDTADPANDMVSFSGLSVTINTPMAHGGHFGPSAGGGWRNAAGQAFAPAQ